MASLLEKLKKRRKAQERAGKETGSAEAVRDVQESAKAFEADIKKEKKKKKQNSNSNDGYKY